MHFKYGGLTRDVTESFKLNVFKGDFTSIVLGGECTIVDTIPFSTYGQSGPDRALTHLRDAAETQHQEGPRR